MTPDGNGIWLEGGEFKSFRKMNWNKGDYYYSIIYVLAVKKNSWVKCDKRGMFNDSDQMRNASYVKFYAHSYNEAVYFMNMSRDEQARYVSMWLENWGYDSDEYNWFVYNWDGKNFSYEDLDLTPYRKNYWVQLNGGDVKMVR